MAVMQPVHTTEHVLADDGGASPELSKGPVASASTTANPKGTDVESPADVDPKGQSGDEIMDTLSYWQSVRFMFKKCWPLLLGVFPSSLPHLRYLPFLHYLPLSNSRSAFMATPQAPQPPPCDSHGSPRRGRPPLPGY